jgi:dUTPase
MSVGRLLPVFIVGNNGKLPIFGDSHAGCFDFFAANDTEILPGQTQLIETDIGLVAAIEASSRRFFLKIFDRSSVAYKKQCFVSAGVIDSSFIAPNTIKVLMTNLSPNSVTFKKHERVAQGCWIESLIPLGLEESSVIRTDGFGSTNG